MLLKSLSWEENQPNGVETNSPWHSRQCLEVHRHRTKSRKETEVLDACQYLPLLSSDFWDTHPSGKTTFSHWISPSPTRYIRKPTSQHNTKSPTFTTQINTSEKWEDLSITLGSWTKMPLRYCFHGKNSSFESQEMWIQPPKGCVVLSPMTRVVCKWNRQNLSDPKKTIPLKTISPLCSYSQGQKTHH